MDVAQHAMDRFIKLVLRLLSFKDKEIGVVRNLTDVHLRV